VIQGFWPGILNMVSGPCDVSFAYTVNCVIELVSTVETRRATKGLQLGLQDVESFVDLAFGMRSPYKVEI
jgi:hypothetical protein